MNSFDRIAQAKMAAIKLVTETLDLNVHRLGIITFGSKAELLCKLTNDKSILVTAIDSISVYGSTEMSGAIGIADEELAKSNNEKAILLITDGDPDNFSNTKKMATQAKEHGISIATIGVQEADEAFLKSIASNSELFFIVDDVSKLADTFGKAVQSLLSKK